MGVSEVSSFIPSLLEALASFVSTGINFYIMATLLVAVLLFSIVKFFRR